MVWAVVTPEINNAINEIEDAQSHRIIAIVGGAILDACLRRALETRLRNDNWNKKMFRVGGALGNTGPKVDLAFQLYMIEKEMREAMLGLSEIRNQFAHRLEMQSFDAPSERLTKQFNKLTMHIGQEFWPHGMWNGPSEWKIEEATDRRGIFLINLKLGLIELFRDGFKHMLYTNQPSGIFTEKPPRTLIPIAPAAPSPKLDDS